MKKNLFLGITLISVVLFVASYSLVKLYLNKQRENKLEKLHSDFRCNRYATGPTYFGICEFQNICMNRLGQFILFANKTTWMPTSWEKGLNEKKWMFTRGRQGACGASYSVKLESGEIIKNGSVHLLNSEHYLAPNFEYFEDPSFVLLRYAAGNAGHMIQESMNMVVHLMLAFGRVNLNNNIIFLEDVTDRSTECWAQSTFGYDINLSEYISTATFSLLSNRPPFQVCSNETGFSIAEHPCRNKVVRNANANREIVACFSSLYGGQSISNFGTPRGRETVAKATRMLAYQSLGIPEVEDLYLKKEVVVVIHKKTSRGRHGRIIHNPEQVLGAIVHKLSELPKRIGKTLKAMIIELDRLPFEEQIKLFSEVDVYITDQGSAAFYATFIRSTSAMITAPRCWDVIGGNKTCDTGEYWSINYVPTTVIDYASLIDRTPDCVPRALRGQVTKVNCDAILDGDVVVNIVEKLITRKYSELFF